MDRAITRPGRIDHIVAVGPPSREARYRILLQLLSRKPIAAIDDSLLGMIADATERFNRAELDRLWDDVAAASWSGDKDGRRVISSLASRWAGSLAITPATLADYVAARNASSYAHIAQGGAE